MSQHDQSIPHAKGAGFATTRWSLVVRAAGEDTQAHAALSELCEAYWYPVYAFVRQRGVPAQDAGDVTQGFFANFLERADVRRADPERGRFRSFLMTAAEHFVSNQRRDATAEKRGGGRAPLSLDHERAEERFRVASPQDDPQQAFERAWAEDLLGRVLGRLRGEYVARGQAELFDHLRYVLGGSDAGVTFRDLAQRTGRSEGALRVASHQMRQRYGEVLRLEVTETLFDPADLEHELMALRQAVAPNAGS